MAEVPEFRWYWLKGKGAGKRTSLRGWLQTFGNRVAALAGSGSLYAERRPQARPGAARGPVQNDHGKTGTEKANRL